MTVIKLMRVEKLIEKAKCIVYIKYHPSNRGIMICRTNERNEQWVNFWVCKGIDKFD